MIIRPWLAGPTGRAGLRAAATPGVIVHLGTHSQPVHHATWRPPFSAPPPLRGDGGWGSESVSAHQPRPVLATLPSKWMTTEWKRLSAGRWAMERKVMPAFWHSCSGERQVVRCKACEHGRLLAEMNDGHSITIAFCIVLMHTCALRYCLPARYRAIHYERNCHNMVHHGNISISPGTVINTPSTLPQASPHQNTPDRA